MDVCTLDTCDAPAVLDVVGRGGIQWPCCQSREHAVAIGLLKGGAKMTVNNGKVLAADLSVVMRQPLDHISISIEK